MSTENNKAIVRRLWEEVWNQNDLSVCDEIFDNEYAEHEKRFAPIMKMAFPDLHFTIEDMIAENDKVVTRLTLTGTHQGEFMGVVATGNPIKVTSIWIHRVSDNRIVEGREWGEFDRLSMMEQLGNSMDDPKKTINPPSAPGLLPMITGFWTSQAIYVAAKLGIADLLQDGTKSSEELAQITETSQRELFRLLRFLAGLGIFAEDDARRFRLTPLAEGLQTNVPGSLNAMAVMYGEEIYQAWGQLLYSIRTGETAFEHVYKSGHFRYLERHQDAAAVYNQAMTGFSMRETAAIVDAYDFSRFRKLVDVGGGQGLLLTAILEANPTLSGVLFDLPQVVAHIKDIATNYEKRCQVIGGDFFTAVPDGGDLYVIKNILLNWDDEQCVTLLKNCRSVMEGNGKVLVVEAVITEGNEPSFSKLLDLHMLVVTGGHGRTESEFRTLFAEAGFRLTTIVPTKSPTSLIEGVPV